MFSLTLQERILQCYVCTYVSIDARLCIVHVEYNKENILNVFKINLHVLCTLSSVPCMHNKLKRIAQAVSSFGQIPCYKIVIKLQYYNSLKQHSVYR